MVSELLDLYLAAAWAVAIIVVMLAVLTPRRPRPRHVWGELSSSDIVAARRRR